MTRQQLEVHMKLSSSLPRRTHYASEMYVGVARNTTGNGGGKYKRPVIVNGVRYESIGEAARHTGVCRQTIYQRIHRRAGASYAR